MTTSLAINTDANPIMLTVTTDRHIETVTASIGGETATGTITWPLTINDTSRTWTFVSDDKALPVSTIVYHG